MSTYIEKTGTNKLQLSGTDDNLVMIKMDCLNGTTAVLSFISSNNSHSIKCGSTAVIDTVEALKNKKHRIVSFSWDAENYDGNAAKATFKIWEQNGASISYTFPDDFKGSPDVPDDEDSPFLTFYCKF